MVKLGNSRGMCALGDADDAAKYCVQYSTYGQLLWMSCRFAIILASFEFGLAETVTGELWN
jgi:hypothetical protein